MLEAMPWLTVTEVAQQTGLSAHTLRYYERVGLLGPVARGEDGHRRYAEADLAWLAFLLRLRTTGMAIRDMQRFAALRREGDATIGSRRELLEHHRDEVLARVEELQADLRSITDKITHYERLELKHEHSDHQQ